MLKTVRENQGGCRNVVLVLIDEVILLRNQELFDWISLDLILTAVQELQGCFKTLEDLEFYDVKHFVSLTKYLKELQ